MNEEQYIWTSDLATLRIVMYLLGRLQPPLSDPLVNVARIIQAEIEWREIAVANALDEEHKP